MNYFRKIEPKTEHDIKCSKDCMIRSVALATGINYSIVHSIMYKHGWRASGKNGWNWENQIINTLQELGFRATKISFPAKKGEPRMNGNRMAQSFSNGPFLLSMARHLSCLKDGYVLDNWNCTEKCVYFAWRIEKI